MTWRIKKHRWPNGREFWTVENREERQVLIGKGGGVSRFHAREMAMASRDEMNGKVKANAGPVLLDDDQ